MAVVNGRGRSDGPLAARALLGVEQLNFNSAISVTHVTPPDHFVYGRKKVLQNIEIAPLEQKLHLVVIVMLVV